MKKLEKIVENYLWQDRKRPIFGLPLSFTKYKLTNEKILIETGVLSISQEEIRLYRIMDVSVRCSLIQRIFRVGTIHCCSADKTTPEFDIKDVKNPIGVKNLISKKVEEERDRKKISSREFMGTDDYDDNHDHYNY
ncbi:MAG: PH domain-containing protein [Bacilli bacterium]|nr:PH domain-containing protein [Bacilli bacterium]